MEDDTNDDFNPETHNYKKSTIISVGSDKPRADVKRFYIDNEKFYEALLERRQQKERMLEINDVSNLPLTDYLGECFYKLAYKLSQKFNFSNVPFKDELISDAIMQCVHYVDTYNPYKTKNPFSYFTQTCYYAFINRIDSEKKQTYLKFKSTVNSNIFNTLSTHEEDIDVEDRITFNQEFNEDYVEQFIEDYEVRMNRVESKKKDFKKQPKNFDLLFAEEECDEIE